MQSGREDTLEKRYAIKLCFKLGKMPQKRMECFRLLFDHLGSGEVIPDRVLSMGYVEIKCVLRLNWGV